VKKVNKSALIRQLYDEGKSIKEIKEKVKCSSALIAIVLRKHKKVVKQSKIIQAVKEMKQVMDFVNHPPHYTTGGIDFLDYAEAKGLTENAYLFNVVKYVSRAGKKVGSDPVQDLEKALFYLKREINIRKEA
jgi:hypothetical protein